MFWLGFMIVSFRIWGICFCFFVIVCCFNLPMPQKELAFILEYVAS